MGCGIRRLPLKLIFLLCAAGLWVCPEMALGQFPGPTLGGATGQIVVRVHESDGSPIGRGAMVTVRSPSQMTNATAPTTDAGQVIFTGLHPGDYVVEVSAAGYRTVQVQAIIAAANESENIDVLLMPDSGSGESQQKPGSPILAPKALKETEKGLQALQADKLDEAEAHLKRAEQMAPGYPDVNYLLGLLWMRRRDNARARGYLEKTISLAPKHAAALQALGEIEYLQHDYPHAVSVLEQSINLRPNSWRAHWFAGASYLQVGDYKKARDACLEALRVGQEKAGVVRFWLGEAQAKLGEREAATASLEQFVREQPNAPQAAIAKKFIEILQAPAAAQIEPASTRKLATTVAAAVPVVNVNEVTTVPIAPVVETNWAPPDIDDEKLAVDAKASCDLGQITSAAGGRVEELVKNVDRFTATEEMEHQSLSPLGVQVSRESRTFNYLVAIQKIGPRALNVEEYRDGSISTQPFPAHLATLGFPMLALVFHPYYRDEYEFRCEGRGEWRGKTSWVVHFRQRDDRMNEMRVYRVSGMSFPVRLKGRAWIDADSLQILAMEADMAKPVPEIRLARDYQRIEYGPVAFHKAKEPLWLPKSADWYCNFMGQRYHRRHSFSQFLLFSVDDSQKVNLPKEELEQK